MDWSIIYLRSLVSVAPICARLRLTSDPRNYLRNLLRIRQYRLTRLRIRPILYESHRIPMRNLERDDQHARLEDSARNPEVDQSTLRRMETHYRRTLGWSDVRCGVSADRRRVQARCDGASRSGSQLASPAYAARKTRERSHVRGTAPVCVPDVPPPLKGLKHG